MLILLLSTMMVPLFLKHVEQFLKIINHYILVKLINI